MELLSRFDPLFAALLRAVSVSAVSAGGGEIHAVEQVQAW